MDHAIKLLFDRLIDLRNRMAAGNSRDPAEEIEILPARAVVHELALATPELDWLTEVQPDAGEEALFVAAHEIRGVVAALRDRGRDSCSRIDHRVAPRCASTAIQRKIPQPTE